MTIDELLSLGPVIPVIVIEDARQAVPLAKALVEGGVRVFEITLRTEAALEAIERTAREVPDAVVGVGTITDPKQFGAARQAGAQFAVTPGLTQDLAWAARENRLPLLPGVMTPSDVITASASGFKELKLFPPERPAASACSRRWPGHSLTSSFVRPAASPPRRRASTWHCPTSPVSAAHG